MFHQFITPVTTKLSFTNASDPRIISAIPVSTITFYSNTPIIENDSSNTLPISNSWDDNNNKLLKCFDHPTPPNSCVEGNNLKLNDDVFRLQDNSVSTHVSTTTCDKDFLINSPEYCPKSPFY